MGSRNLDFLLCVLGTLPPGRGSDGLHQSLTRSTSPRNIELATRFESASGRQQVLSKDCAIYRTADREQSFKGKFRRGNAIDGYPPP